MKHWKVTRSLKTERNIFVKNQSTIVLSRRLEKIILNNNDHLTNAFWTS